MPSVAIVGAGVAGLACARVLVQRGAAVTLFDKGRGVGGRLATRRLDEHAFDLGAQYFTVRDERFARASRGASEVWRGRIAALEDVGTFSAVEPTERWVGAPSMSALGRHLAAGLDVRTGHRVDRIERVAGRFALHGTASPGETLPPSSGTGADDLGRFDRVVVTVPAPQAITLVGDASATLAAQAAAVLFEPCFAVGIVAPVDVPFDGVFIGRESASPSTILAWAARDSSKPGRPPGERWVLHARGDWSAVTDEARALPEMVAELARLFAVAPLQPTASVIRRWSLARAATPLDVAALVDDGIALGGDWTAGGRVEGAFLSGLALADQLA